MKLWTYRVETPMLKKDREALKRAIQMAKDDPAERQWILEKIRDDGWEEAGLSASYHYQVETLCLKPWNGRRCGQMMTNPTILTRLPAGWQRGNCGGGC
jgi:hypothetical protein